MSKELDDVLLELAKRDRIHETFMALGATSEQADIAASTPKITNQFQWTGALLTFQKCALMKADDGKLVKKWMTENKFDFLLPAATPDPIKALDIDPALLASARAGNWTAKSQIFTTLHAGKPKSAIAETQAVLATLLADTGGTDADKGKDEPAQKLKGRDNPWSAASWNVTAQARLVREIGLAAAQSIAKAQGSFVGATKPNRAA
jgi:hypothetical protein